MAPGEGRECGILPGPWLPHHLPGGEACLPDLEGKRSLKGHVSPILGLALSSGQTDCLPLKGSLSQSPTKLEQHKIQGKARNSHS